MITAKTTALILAMTVIGAATPAAFATTNSGGGGIAVITGTQQTATNSDDDTNNQLNYFAPTVKSEQKIKQNSGVQGSAFVIIYGTALTQALRLQYKLWSCTKGVQLP